MPVLPKPSPVILAALAAGTLACSVTSAQCVNPAWLPFDPSTASFPGTDTWVTQQTLWDPDGAGPLTPVLVVAGGFTVVGNIVANHIATFDPATEQWGTLGSGVGENANQWAGPVAACPNGDLFVGGHFSDFYDAPGVPSLTHWTGTAWEYIANPMDAGITALAAMPNGDLVASGYTFVFYDPDTNETTVSSSIQRWDGTTWTDLGANIDLSLGEYTTGLVALPNGDLIVCGSFTSAGGTPAANIARFDGAVWSALGAGTDGGIQSVTRLPGGDLVAAGLFTTAGGTPANNIARWDGIAWSSLGAGTDGTDPYGAVLTVTTLANGDLVAGGYFTLAGGASANRIARWDGANWLPIGAGLSGGPAGSIAQLPGGDLIAGGMFSSAGGVAARNLARWNGAGWSALGTGPDSYIFAFLNMPNGDVVVAGQFTTIGGVPASNIALWNGTAWSSLGSGLGTEPQTVGSVRALALMPNGDVVAAGFFTYAGGAPANYIARWDGAAWTSLGAGLSDSIWGPSCVVRRLAVLPGGDLIAGGNFYYADGAPARFVARWDGAAWSALGSGLIGDAVQHEVDALTVLSNGDLIVGGLFSYADGTVDQNIARWDGTAWSGLGSGIDFYGVRDLITLPNNDVVAVGLFENAGGVPANKIARWDGAAWSTFGTGIAGYDELSAVTSLPTGDIIVGGYLSDAGGTPVHNIARWDGAAWNALSAGTNSAVLALGTLPDGSLIAGGGFTVAGGIVAPYLAKYGCPPCPADYNGDGFMDGIDYDLFNADFENLDPAQQIRADYNHDGFVDGIDYDLFMYDFETGC